MAVEAKVSPVLRITAARTAQYEKITPDIFISNHTFLVLSHYRRFKNFGMMLPNPSEGLMKCFDVIQNTLDRIESKKLKGK